MARALQEQLAGLVSDTRGQPGVVNARISHESIGNIGAICLNDVNASDVDLAYSVIFNHETGLIKFLKKIIQNDEFEGCKCEILELLKTFISKFPGKVHPYAVDVKDACLQLITRDRRARVKNNATPLLIELLKQTSGLPVAGDLQVEGMIERLFKELIKSPKPAASVKAHIFHLLGVIAELFPEKMVRGSDKLLNLYMTTLKQEIESKTHEPEYVLIAGCLQGLTHFMVNFTQSADEGAEHAYSIYKYCVKTMDQNIKKKRYEMPKASLGLMAKHSAQMSDYLLDDFKDLYETLSYWTNHNNREMAHIGMLALEDFLVQISSALVTKVKEGNRKEGAVFKFFIQKFRDIMDNNSSGSKEIAIAIKGYGYFAAPCKLYLTPKDVLFMFNEMLHRSEQLFLSGAEQNDDRIIGLHSFLGALASIVEELDQFSETFLFSLERLVVLQMQVLPRLHVKLHNQCYIALIRLFLGLALKGSIFKGFLERIIYQSLIRSCSHPIVLESQEAKSENVDEVNLKVDVSYQDYLPMWKALLTAGKLKALGQYNITAEQHRVLASAIYDELLSAMLKMISRLDLSSNSTDSESQPSTSEPALSDPSSDPLRGLHAVCPEDFILLTNLVELSRDLLPVTQTQKFSSWVFPFGHQLILQSSKLPLVSGLYKMLTVCMQVASQISYFKEMNRQLKIETSDSIKMEMDEEFRTSTAQEEACFMLFTKFAKEVMTRLRQYKDDLLASCLGFILALPREIIALDVTTFVPALQRSLEIGRSYLPLARTSLNTLESWSKSLPPDVMKPFYEQLLPYLDAYLTSSADEKNDTLSLVQKDPMKKQGKKKIPVKLLKQTMFDAEKGKESELKEIQRKCVLLLGSLGGSINHALVFGQTANPPDLVAWDSDQHLKFDLPFLDIKTSIYFDAFLPKVVTLATVSSDRQTKVAACELLHSLVLLMLGRSASQPTGNPMAAIYRKLFPQMLKLATDVEQVSRQLFEPLMLQIIHWFTKSNNSHRPDTEALLNSLMDGIVSPSDSAVRDFSAKCIREFLAWSIKQTSPKEMEAGPANPKRLLKRMYSLLEHPSSMMRLGGALMFNSIYSVFREEDALVDQFSLQILSVLVNSLALAHRDDKSLGTQEQCKSALLHVERILIKKQVTFNKDSKQRIKPRGWRDANMTTAVRWLLRQCGRPQTECRHVCMRLVCQLAPCVHEINGARELFSVLLSQGNSEYFIQRFEFGMYSSARMGLNQKPTMSRVQENFSLNAACTWFDLVLATLDCYTWVFGERLMSPNQILIASNNKGTIIFQVLHHFMEELAQEDISAAVKLFPKVADGSSIFTPREREDYNQTKCTVIVRTLSFICTMFGNYKTESLKVIPTSFWSSNLWDTLLLAVLQPTQLGFNMGQVEVMNHLPEQTLGTLQILMRSLPRNLAQELIESVSRHLNMSSCDLSSKLPIPLLEPNQDYIQLRLLVSGFEQLNSAGLLSNTLVSKSSEKLAEDLVNTVFMGMVTAVDGKPTLVNLSPVSQSLAEKMLTLAFQMGYPEKNLVELIFNSNNIHGVSTSVQCSPHGTLFYAAFKSVVNLNFVKSVEKFVPLLMRHLEANGETLSSVLIGIADHGKMVSRAIVSQWSSLSVWWSESTASLDTKMVAITLLTKLMQIDSTVIIDVKNKSFYYVFKMFLGLISDKNNTLQFKTRVLDLLIFFCNLPAEENKQLESCLNQFVADCFPMSSLEFHAGSQQQKCYITALDRLLLAMELSGSLMLLNLIISVICKEVKHTHENAIQSAFQRFIKRLPKDKHKLALDVPYKIFSQEGRFTNNQRRAACEKVSLSLMRLVHSSALTEFYCEHIKEIMKIIEAKPTKAPEHAFEAQLTSKIGCFELLEVMYSRLPNTDVNSKDSSINKSFCSPKIPDTGKEMNLTITKVSNATKGENMNGETLLIPLRRALHCAAYNTLIAALICTQKEKKFYTAFLFTENPAKNQLHWNNIVDQDVVYEFPLEMENPIERRKKFVSIRTSVRDVDPSDEPTGPASSVHYLASQYLAGSSLSTDVSQFDFGSSMVSSADSSFDNQRSRESSIEVPDVVLKEHYIEMEMDALNQHPCMAALSALLQHMKLNQITPEVEKGSKPSSMPDWMKNIHDKIKNSDTQLNIRLFLAKVILNGESVFRPYASFWFQPLVALATNMGGLNYFSLDIIVTLLSWHEIAIPEETTVDIAMTSHLVKYIVQNCYHQNRQIMRNNLEVLKTDIYENFIDREDKGKRNVVGLQIVGVFLANGLSPWQPDAEVSKDRFYQYLAMNMNQPDKQVYSASAEIVGMALSSLQNTESDKEWCRAYGDNIQKMLLGIHGNKPDQFLTCVHCIQKHFSAFVERFIHKVLFMLPGLYGVFRTYALEIIAAGIENIEGAFVEIKNKNIIGILRERDEAQSESRDEIITLTKDVLLRGLSDDDLTNRLTVQNFWSHETRLPGETVERLVAMLEAMYTPSTELHYLSYATNLLLEMTTKSSDFNRVLFDTPLSECKFQDFAVSSTWYQRHAAMTPMFLDTQSSQSNDSPDAGLSTGQLRATQDAAQFTQTQADGSSKGPYNWLTQSSLDTFSDSQNLTLATQSESSLMFTVGSSRIKSSKKTPGSEFGQRKVRSDVRVSAMDEANKEIMRLKRRFIHDQESTARFFMKRNVRMKKMREDIQREQKMKREHQVTMYRQYRTGDFPDIQIKYSFLIAPLQALAQRDSTIAKLLFVAVFQAIFTQIESEKTERESQSLVAKIESSLNKILETSTQYFSPFIGCVLEIAYLFPKQLKLQPGVVSTVCNMSDQQPLGILLLEEGLLHSPEDQSPASKRSRRDRSSRITQDTEPWLELAKLYKSISDYDVLRGIFSSQIGSKPATRLAIEAETRGDYRSALQLYNEEVYLPPMLRSKIKLILNGDTSQDNLLSFIEESLKTPVHKAFIEGSFSSELALVCIHQELYDKAKHYANMSLQAFIQDWANLSTTRTSTRATKLQKLQEFTEMQEFLSVIKTTSGEDFPRQIDRTLHKWEARSPDRLLDSVVIWDNIILNRNVYMDHFAEHLTSIDAKIDPFGKQRVVMSLAQVDAASLQGNHSVARKLLKSAKDLVKVVDSEELSVLFTHSHANANKRKCASGSEPSERLNLLVEVKKRLDKCSESSTLKLNAALLCDQHLLQGEHLVTMATILQNQVKDIDALDQKLLEKITESVGSPALSHQEIVASLHEAAYNSFKSGVGVAASQPESVCVNKAYMSLVHFCDQVLRQRENDEISGTKCESEEDFPLALVTSLLSAMKNSSKDARQLFPRLLQIIERFPQTREVFIRKSRDIPAWMFLGWVSQICAILDKPESSAIHEILLNIADIYPNALVFPFKLSNHNYKFTSDAVSSKSKSVCDRLHQMLSKNPLIDRLIFSLEMMHEPAVIIKDWIMDMKNAKGPGGSSQSLSMAYVKERYQELYKELLCIESEDGSLYSDSADCSMGPYRSDFVKQFISQFDEYFGKMGSKIPGLTFMKVLSWLSDKSEKVKKAFSNKQPRKLKEYSQWLAEFQAGNHEASLEIPGQYTGEVCPLPEYHAKISSFDSQVTVLRSLRMPKSIVIRGNDEKEYKFLVKGGEDLRQDQRVQQVFNLMNEIYANDANCHARRLQLKTFQVIPMTPRLGMIEWLKNSCTLKDFLRQGCSDVSWEQIQNKNLPNNPANLLCQWIGDSSNTRQMIENYRKCYQKYSRNETLNAFKKREAMVPWDMLRKSYQKLASSPESYFVLRGNCATSHALNCISAYIMGIGDRHLSNHMVDLINGKMIAIDFGHAFGSATQFLDIPELIPFRMTRQLRNLLLPLREKGVIEGTMVHSLRALRQHKEQLISTMDVFIKEPSLDWQNAAKKEIQAMSNRKEDTSKLTLDSQWFPKEKVNIVRQKLEGSNPSHVMRAELALGQLGSYLKYFVIVLMGDKQADIRARLPADGLSSEEQVAALLNLATDPNILGRTFAGWEPWV
ncbi:hypothetical protein CAPTEDRAFT_224273 [Capitella teleta]|uniref:DNA-dependent protein kinase catalytic subunit n=2 Tax=Capitella teleta TaxID=283909 RepID=R7UX97_CAPTE|nr:hypothetical protein CAPTEDRAFT_224273 [Capitella teleta]|eukprot:ELU11183.1 hypothetical protein CAPTEDRAFT_224273 [Capitella teleta]